MQIIDFENGISGEGGGMPEEEVRRLLALKQDKDNNSDLETESKSIVGAINEVNNNVNNINDGLSSEISRATEAENLINNNIGDLTQLATDDKSSIVNSINEVDKTTSSTKDEILRLSETVFDDDLHELPKLCGQPCILFGAGTPQESIVPDNWIQFDPITEEGYNWTGVPTAIGQLYINTTATVNGRYISVRDGNYSLKWLNF